MKSHHVLHLPALRNSLFFKKTTVYYHLVILFIVSLVSILHWPSFHSVPSFVNCSFIRPCLFWGFCFCFIGSGGRGVVCCSLAVSFLLLFYSSFRCFCLLFVLSFFPSFLSSFFFSFFPSSFPSFFSFFVLFSFFLLSLLHLLLLCFFSFPSSSVFCFFFIFFFFFFFFFCTGVHLRV